MENKENRIGQDFTTMSLALFALPSFFTNLIQQLFKSLDDGLFISRYVGEKALASLNILNPIVGFQQAIEHLFSLGAANISAKLMGEGKQQEAKRVFSRVCITGFGVGLIVALTLNIFSHPILSFLGADDELASYAIYQIRIVYAIAPFVLLNRIFNCYYSTAGKPKMGMYCSIINGTTNIGLDIILIVYLKLGVIGACIATAAGELSVFIFGLIFYCNKNNEIHFVKPEGEFIKTSFKSAKFALPQCLNSISFSTTNFITNQMILSIIGNTGIAANAVISDIRKIITSGLFGFAICVGPIISYNVGNKNVKRLKKLFKEIATIWLCGSSLLTIVGLLLRRPLILIFMNENTSVEFYNMTYLALSIEMFATIFASGSVTINRSFIALGNTKVAAFLSVSRNFITKAICYIALPLMFGEIGIWSSFLVSEVMAFIIEVIVVYKNRDNYGYGKSGLAIKII